MTNQLSRTDGVGGGVGHTAGPWYATTRRGSWDWLVASVSDPNTEICQMFHDGTELNELGEANSKLVATAPELLAVAKLAHEALELAICIANDAANEWDKAPEGMKAGKMLLALAGHRKGYMATADKIHAVLPALASIVAKAEGRTP